MDNSELEAWGWTVYDEGFARYMEDYGPSPEDERDFLNAQALKEWHAMTSITRTERDGTITEELGYVAECHICTGH